ncbi:hypothetical protein US8_00104 [Bacillus altitudinis]|nr:hypothetical protein US8_00104 [Bacillus altitudinis]
MERSSSLCCSGFKSASPLSLFYSSTFDKIRRSLKEKGRI